jgi:GGDEF domain-containing protein
MSQSAYRTAPHAREADIIGRKALEFLSIHHLDLTPSNYELIYEVLRGRDKALREAFVALPKPVSQAALSTLAHTFIRKLPLVANLRSASDDALAALDTFRKRLESGTVTVVEAEEGASGQLAGLDAEIRHCVEALQAVVQLVTPKPEEMEGQEHLAAQLTFGLPSYAALEDRLSLLFSEGLPEDGVSLMLCRIDGLEPLGRSGLAQVGDYMKNTLARFTHRLIDKSDTAYWTGPDELSLLVGSSSETYLSQLGEKISRVVADAETIARRSIKSMPKLACHFGCARTHRPVATAQLYGAARQSLQRAQLNESHVPVFAEVSADAATLRRYEALYGRHMR